MILQAAMITKDAQACLAKCLESIGAVPVLILDLGSTDSTCALARSMGAKVLEGRSAAVNHHHRPTVYTWTGDLAHARNFVLGHAQADWILTIKADEYLNEGGIQAILDGIGSNPSAKCFRVSCQNRLEVRVHRRGETLPVAGGPVLPVTITSPPERITK